MENTTTDAKGLEFEKSMISRAHEGGKVGDTWSIGISCSEEKKVK